jgi:hypothetical protein
MQRAFRQLARKSVVAAGSTTGFGLPDKSTGLLIGDFGLERGPSSRVGTILLKIYRRGKRWVQPPENRSVVAGRRFDGSTV